MKNKKSLDDDDSNSPYVIPYLFMALALGSLLVLCALCFAAIYLGN